MKRLSLLLATFLLGCPVIEPDDVVIVDEFTAEPTDLDVLLVVDNSNSMGEVHLALVGLAQHLQSSLDGDGIDYRVGLITTDMSDPDHRGRMHVFGDGNVYTSPATGVPAADLADAFSSLNIDGSNLERGLEAAWAALSPPLATHDNAGFRRDDVGLAIIVISDEDDCSDEGALTEESPGACQTNIADLVSTDEYVARFRSLVVDPADFGLWALVETGITAEFEGCGGSTPGGRYIEVARKSAGGVHPLCDLELGLGWATGEARGNRRAIALTRTPDPSTLLVEAVTPDGAAATISRDPTRTEGWTYDADSNTVRLWGTAQPEFLLTIRITYSVGGPTP